MPTGRRRARTSGLIVLLVLGCGDGAGGPREQDAGLLGQVMDAGNGMDASAPPDAGVGADALPYAKLSETGLYADTALASLADGVRAYHPQGVLFADGAEKQRWVLLPANAKIDTTDMDAWIYPTGTKIWKEFLVGPKRVETRLMEKRAEGWLMVAFQWQDDQLDAVPVSEGVADASGTQHDIPSRADCKRCHDGMADKVLGFSAVQLAHSQGDLTLDGLAGEGRLSQPPSAPVVVPGDPITRSALLYLHANCGSCHNPRTFISGTTGVDYWLRTGRLGAVEQTSSHHTVALDLQRAASAEKTKILTRMKFLGQGQMPPIGREQVDEQGVSVIDAWLAKLSQLDDAGIH